MTATGSAGACQTLAGLGYSAGWRWTQAACSIYADRGRRRACLLRLRGTSRPCATPRPSGVVQHRGRIGFNCTDVNHDPLTYTITAAPNTGQLGAIDQGAGRVFYNPFLGYTGADQFSYKATGSRRGLRAGHREPQRRAGTRRRHRPAQWARCRPRRVHGRSGLQRQQPEHPARGPGDQGQQHRRELRRDCRAVPDAGSGVVHNWGYKGSKFTLNVLAVTQSFPKGWSARSSARASRSARSRARSSRPRRSRRTPRASSAR